MSRRRSVALVLAGAVLLGGCTQPPAPATPSTSTSTDQLATTVADDLPPPHPAFARHFKDPLYSDLGDEDAPFGSDEGYDMLFEWVDRRDELGTDSTVIELLDGTGFADMVQTLDVPEGPGAIPEPAGQVDAATIIIGAGFTVLRLTGQIDAAGKQLVLKALDILIARSGGSPVLVRQRDDLRSWAD